MEVLMYLISNAVHVYAVYIVISTFLGVCNLSSRQAGILYFIYTLVTSILPIAAQGNPGVLLLHFPALLLLTLLYRGTRSRRLLCAGTICAVDFLLGFGVYALFRSGIPAAGILFRNVAALTLAFVFKRRYRRSGGEPAADSPYICCLIITAIGTVTVGLLTVNEETPHDYGIAVILLLVNLLNFCCVNKLEQKKLETEQMLQITEVSCRAYRNQIQMMTESQRKLRFMRHDMKRHLFRIRDMVNSGNSAEIPSYIGDMEAAVCVPNLYAQTGNREIDSLINYELGLAAELGTEIACKIDLPAELHVAPFDMTVILGNLLDNALEALRGTEHRSLTVSITDCRGVIKVDIRNSCDARAHRAPDGNEHGIGMRSIRSALRKYHGSLRAVPAEHEYHTTVTFFNSAVPVSAHHL